MGEIKLGRHVEFEQVVTQIESFDVDQRLTLAQKLLGQDSGLVVILGGHSIGLHGDAYQMSGQLKQVPPEMFEELLKAIAIRIAQDKADR